MLKYFLITILLLSKSFSEKCTSYSCQTQGLACVENNCVGCTADDQCYSNQCDTKNNKCVECKSNQDCFDSKSSWCDTTDYTCKYCRNDKDCAMHYDYCHPDGKTGCVEDAIECTSNGNCLDVTKSQCSNYKCTACQTNDHCSHLQQTPICHPQQNKCVQTLESDLLENCCQNNYKLTIKKPSQMVAKPEEDMVFENGSQQIKLEFELSNSENFGLEFSFRQAFVNKQIIKPIAIEISGDTKVSIKLNPSNLPKDSKIQIILEAKEQHILDRRILAQNSLVILEEQIKVVTNKNDYLTEINNSKKPMDNNNNNNIDNNYNENINNDKTIDNKKIQSGKNDDGDDDDDNKTLIIVLVILGVFVFISSLAGIAVYIYRRNLKQKKQNLYSEGKEKEQVKSAQNDEQQV